MTSTTIPEYFVSSGISGAFGSQTTYATYVRRPTGSLRRVHSRDGSGHEHLPDRFTRLAALEDLYRWLGTKQVRSTPGTGYEEYGRQAARIYAEMQAEKGKASQQEQLGRTS